MTTRFTQGILISCEIPWGPDEELLEPLFRAEIRRVIAKTVAEEIDKPEVRKARYIDVAAELARALEGPVDDEAAALAEVREPLEHAIDEVSREDTEALEVSDPNAGA